MSANLYDLAFAEFSNAGVPSDQVSTMATIAVAYSQQTGISITSLVVNGVIDNGFLSAFNALRNPSNQMGIIAVDLNPTWQSNIVLVSGIASAGNSVINP